MYIQPTSLSTSLLPLSPHVKKKKKAEEWNPCLTLPHGPTFWTLCFRARVRERGSPSIYSSTLTLSSQVEVGMADFRLYTPRSGVDTYLLLDDGTSFRKSVMGGWITISVVIFSFSNSRACGTCTKEPFLFIFLSLSLSLSLPFFFQFAQWWHGRYFTYSTNRLRTGLLDLGDE